MNYLEEILEKFNNLPPEIKDQIGGEESFSAIEAIEDEYDVELKFLVMLVVTGEIAVADMVPYLQQRNGLAEEDAAAIKSELLVKVLTKILPKQEPLTDSEEISVTPSRFVSAEDLKEVLTKGLLQILKNKKDSADFNTAIFVFFSQNGDLQEELGKVLIENTEVLTTQGLVFDDRKVPGTISNWLKDFIRQNGSELFNTVVLAKYLSTSPSTKGLAEGEKKTLNKILKLYRNLVFFPASLANTPVEEWEIIPLDNPVAEIPIPSMKMPVKPLAPEVKVSPVKPMAKPTSQIRPDDLKALLAKYPAETLERQAVEEELKWREQSDKR